METIFITEMLLVLSIMTFGVKWLSLEFDQWQNRKEKLDVLREIRTLRARERRTVQEIARQIFEDWQMTNTIAAMAIA